MTRQARPRRHCCATKDNVRCQNWAIPGKRLCSGHAAARQSQDPERRARQLANLGPNNGNQHTRAPVEPDRKLVAERAEALAAQVPVRDADGVVPSGLLRIVNMAARGEVELDELQRKAKLTVREERRREVVEKRVDAYHDRLGLSVKALLDIEPMRKINAAMAAQRARPPRTEERAAEVAAILAQCGGIPGYRLVPIEDTESEPAPADESTAEVVPLREAGVGR